MAEACKLCARVAPDKCKRHGGAAAPKTKAARTRTGGGASRTRRPAESRTAAGSTNGHAPVGDNAARRSGEAFRDHLVRLRDRLGDDIARLNDLLAVL